MAIDPGPERSAWCTYDISFNPTRISAGILPNEDVKNLVACMEDATLVVEGIASYGMPVGAEVFETCIWIGRFIESHLGMYRLIYRKDVKMHLCGSMRANDAAIRQRLIDIFGPPGTKKNPGKLYGISKDMWSALALAVTAAET